MTINSINPKTLQSWLQNQQAILIDVREVFENKAARIKAATLIPLATININNLPELADKKLVIHCKSGVRSFNACRLLLAQNPNLEIYNLEGGIESWIAAGCEIQTN
ncbi:MAG: rhodanese-like domain-containing protein [Pseudomonadota bacterium]